MRVICRLQPAWRPIPVVNTCHQATANFWSSWPRIQRIRQRWRWTQGRRLVQKVIGDQLDAHSPCTPLHTCYDAGVGFLTKTLSRSYQTEWHLLSHSIVHGNRLPVHDLSVHISINAFRGGSDSEEKFPHLDTIPSATPHLKWII
jgi:hypothetical protein